MAVVLRWAGLETDDHSPDLFGALIGATDVPSLTLANGELASVAPQKVVMGDVDGNIGFRVSGSIPRRHGYTGRVPHPASSGELHWDGFLDDAAIRRAARPNAAVVLSRALRLSAEASASAACRSNQLVMRLPRMRSE